MIDWKCAWREFWGDKNYVKSYCVGCKTAFTKYNWIIHLHLVNFVTFKVYFNEMILKNRLGNHTASLATRKYLIIIF